MPTKKHPFKRSRWEPGKIYGIPLLDGSFCFAQAIALALTNIVDVVIYSQRTREAPHEIPELGRGSLIAFSATWKQDLERGEWLALGVGSLLTRPEESPNQKILATGTWVGVEHSDIGLLSDLCNAWYGLIPWNVMFEEDYYDKWLAPGVARPATAKVLSSEERKRYREHDLENS